MKVAILGSRGYPSTYGGFETLVRRLAPYLRDRGMDVTVYCRTRGTRPRTQSVDGIRCRHTPGIESTSLSTLSFGFTGFVDAFFRGFDAALVLNVANGYYLPLLRAAGTPVAVNVDGIEWERAKWGPAARGLFRLGAALTARLADRLVFDSRAIGSAWRSLFGRSGEFIPYGADLVSDRPVDRLVALGLHPHRYVLVVARLVPENNVALTLDALERSPEGTAMVVVGSDGRRGSDIEGRLRTLAATRPDFHWLGHVHDQDLLTDLWAHCGVYVHGHSAGGTNPALLQALGCGSPTLALDTPYNREVLVRDRHLYPLDADRLSRRIAAVLADKREQDRLAEWGREQIRTRYRWATVCEAYGDLLAGLAAGDGPAPVMEKAC